MILNLDASFQPYPQQESIAYEQFTFSGGEPHLKILSDLSKTKTVLITHRVRSFNDFGVLLLAVDALKRLDISQIDLLLPYFPGARQDRVMHKGEALTVKVYADLLNKLKLNSISIFDPHSEVTPALLRNCVVIPNHRFIQKIIQTLDQKIILISPDAGATKKIYALAPHLPLKRIIECSKTRDPKTGALSSFQVYADDLKGQDCLIVDDICDGGGTFIGLAQELKRKGAGKLYLAISHGIFRHGLSKLTHYFSGIYTTDAFQNLECNATLQQIRLADIL